MSTKTVNLNVRTNKELKEKVSNILQELGLDHSTVINMLYRQIALRKEVPFEIKIPNSETREAISELESDNSLSTYENSDAMWKDLKE